MFLNDAIFSNSFIGTFCFCIGACFGSFANVLIYRIPKGESVVLPGSRCQSCGVPIRWFDNIPIFSWFLLRGKCRKCKASYSIRYALVELITATLFLFLFLRLGLSWTLLEYFIFTVMAVSASGIDLDHMILPDVFTLSGLGIALLGSLINPERQFLDSLLGFLAGGGFLWSVAYGYYLLRKEEGMGGGDIKLLAWIGALLGWKSIPFIILSSSLVGALFGLILMIQSKKGLKLAIPFGPYLVFGAYLFIFGGEELAQWYIKLFIPELSGN
jgi:leader peptidase (prepilin peptidase)/N-methyltransferase